MQSKIVLVSDDLNFFEYVIPKLTLRKSDELYRFSFDDLPNKIQFLKGAALIINSESAEDKTLELLKILKESPSIIFSYNNNKDFEIKLYNLGAYACVTPLDSDEEIQAKLIPVLTNASLIEKNSLYREILVKNKLISYNNEVYLDYEAVLDSEITKIQDKSASAILLAIAPSDKTKFRLQANQIETIILNNIRKNDILMNFAPNKYFLILHDTNLDCARNIWEKIESNLPEKIYVGMTNVANKNRQKLVHEVLNKLHEAINYDKSISTTETANIEILNTNFKLYKQEFKKKIEKVVLPVFYTTQQSYNNKLFGMTLEQKVEDGLAEIIIKGRNTQATFRITSPGFSKINIDIIYDPNLCILSKRINLEPQEFEAGILEDLIEQFVNEFKTEVCDDNA